LTAFTNPRHVILLYRRRAKVYVNVQYIYVILNIFSKMQMWMQIRYDSATTWQRVDRFTSL